MLKWITSSFTDRGNCVQVARDGNGDTLVRNSNDSPTSILRFTPGEWNAFLEGIDAGEFDEFGL